ncbi:MAG: hypothetical protein K6G29_10575 [Clostridiales bacterium]|nr:hypothetical protein [Clostridiales bacterium]
MRHTKRWAVLLLALCAFFAGCAQREPEEQPEEKKVNEIGIDRDWYLEEYLAREDQEGYLPYNSKYGYDLPEIASFTEGFVDYLGYSVNFTAPYEGTNPDFLEDGEGGVFVFRNPRAPSGTSMAYNIADGIVYYDADGIPSRICIDPDCTIEGHCTHGMNISESFVRYWKGNLYFIGYREEAWPEGYDHDGIQSAPLRSYVMRYDINTATFHKVIEFFDRTCSLFVIRDGVLFMVSGEDGMDGGNAQSKYLSCIDLEAGEACRIGIGISDAYGICEGKIVLQSGDYGKRWYEVEHRVMLLDPESMTRRTLATYTDAYAGAAGKYVVYLGRWQRGVSCDLYRRDPNADNPEVMGRDVVKFRMIGDRCIWLCADGTLWRSNVIAYKPKKIASRVADFRIQDDGRIVYFAESRFRGVKVSDFGIDTLAYGSLWITSTGLSREKIWEASGSTSWLGTCAVGANTAFITAMYKEMLWPNNYEYRETRIVKRDLDGTDPQILYRRAYRMTDEEWRAHQIWIDERYDEDGDYYVVKNTFRYYAQKSE